jgi:hypothetical protein
MSDNQITPVTDIIREAEAVSELTIDELVSQYIGQSPSKVTAALSALVNDGHYDDIITWGDTDVSHRVDRWILVTDSRGFVSSDEYDTEALAIAEFRTLREVHDN